MWVCVCVCARGTCEPGPGHSHHNWNRQALCGGAEREGIWGNTRKKRMTGSVVVKVTMERRNVAEVVREEFSVIMTERSCEEEKDKVSGNDKFIECIPMDVSQIHIHQMNIRQNLN